MRFASWVLCQNKGCNFGHFMMLAISQKHSSKHHGAMCSGFKWQKTAKNKFTWWDYFLLWSIGFYIPIVCSNWHFDYSKQCNFSNKQVKSFLFQNLFWPLLFELIVRVIVGLLAQICKSFSQLQEHFSLTETQYNFRKKLRTIHFLIIACALYSNFVKLS